MTDDFINDIILLKGCEGMDINLNDLIPVNKRRKKILDIGNGKGFYFSQRVVDMYRLKGGEILEMDLKDDETIVLTIIRGGDEKV